MRVGLQAPRRCTEIKSRAAGRARLAVRAYSRLKGSHDPGNRGRIASAKGKSWAKVCLADHDPETEKPVSRLFQVEARMALDRARSAGRAGQISASSSSTSQRSGPAERRAFSSPSERRSDEWFVRGGAVCLPKARGGRGARPWRLDGGPRLALGVPEVTGIVVGL